MAEAISKVVRRFEAVTLPLGLAMMGGAIIWQFGFPGLLFVAGFTVFAGGK